MKKQIAIICAFVTAVSSFTWFVHSQDRVYASLCSHGYYTLGDKRLVGGIGNFGNSPVKFYIDSTIYNLGTAEGMAVCKGISSWKNNFPSSPFYVTQQYGNSTGATFTFKNEELEEGVAGDTEHFTNIGRAFYHYNGNLFTNYDYTIIYLDCSKLDGTICATSNNYFDDIATTTAHEVGHAMGLAHRDGYTVMVQYSEDFQCDSPALTDIMTMIHVYS